MPTDEKALTWKRIIRGDEEGNYYPAKKFYDELIPKYFGEYGFVKNLIIPEVSIFEITKVYVKDLYEQQVDFYLPQASLIIEVDGAQHLSSIGRDRQRDLHTSKHGIETIRITGDRKRDAQVAGRHPLKQGLKHLFFPLFIRMFWWSQGGIH